MERKGNYEIQRDYAQTVFLKYNQQIVIDKLHLQSDETYIYLTFVKRDYRINRMRGVIEYMEADVIKEADFEETLSIFDLLCYGDECPRACGIWAPINSVRYTPRAIGVQTNFSSVQAKFFNQHEDNFRQACAKLGGMEVAIGDIGYEIPIFGEIKVRLKFYFSDEEFPAQLVMLWDADILKYMRYETTFYVMGHIYKRLMKEAGGREK